MVSPAAYGRSAAVADNVNGIVAAELLPKFSIVDLRRSGGTSKLVRQGIHHPLIGLMRDEMIDLARGHPRLLQCLLRALRHHLDGRSIDGFAVVHDHQHVLRIADF